MATHEIPNAMSSRAIRHHAVYAIHYDTREVCLLGVTAHPTVNSMTNVGRMLCDIHNGFALNKTYCLMDGDMPRSEGLKECLRSVGCQPKKLPPRSPNLNAYMVRFLGTVKSEVMAEVIPKSAEQLHRLLQTHAEYYNHRRNHQGLANHVIPKPDQRILNTGPDIERSSRLGGLLNFYHRSAA